MWPITLSGRLPIVDLVSRYLTNYLIRRELTSYRISLTPVSCGTVVLCGISTCFQVLSPCMRQIAHALLTRSPLSYIQASSPATPFDLHVLSTPPAFVLSQDQTLVFNPQSGSYWFSPAPRLKLIPELTVVSPLTLYRFQGSPLASRVSFVTLSRERLIILTQPASFVNTFFKVFFDFFQLFSFPEH